MNNQRLGAAPFTEFVKGADFYFSTVRSAGTKYEAKLEEGNYGWPIRKPAPLKCARVRHPVVPEVLIRLALDLLCGLPRKAGGR
jgi:hypothetical protein